MPGEGKTIAEAAKVLGVSEPSFTVCGTVRRDEGR